MSYDTRYTRQRIDPPLEKAAIQLTMGPLGRELQGANPPESHPAGLTANATIAVNLGQL